MPDDLNHVLQQLGEIGGQVRFTPAERALLTEQANNAIMALNRFISKIEEGQSRAVIDAYVPVTRAVAYAENVIIQKMSDVVINAVMEGGS